ncbi:MAG TPA: DUF2437 domain-containing protein, partial [Egibacteraceae bacterium]|nr:DUF2437 domain-containing protein [Egibacteraceae bacterium]
MRLIRFRSFDGAERVGALQGVAVHDVRGDVLHAPQLGPAVAELADVRLLAPCLPSKVVCVGRN